LATLDLKHLLKIFGSEVRAVDGIDLNIRHGELISLLGPSGCGKTTTLRLVAGFIDPDGGAIEVEGEVISSPGAIVPPERRNMSMIFQSYAVWPHKTVYQNVAYGLKFRDVTIQESDQKVRKMLDIVQMGHLGERYPGELSGGQQQRVALARALVVEPSILLLDEPLSNLDANLREEMRFEIRRLHDEFHITSIYVTHDQSEAMVTSDRICLMNHGKIEQVGTAMEIYDNPETRFVAEFVGVTNSIEGSSPSPGLFDTGGDLKFKVGSNGAAGAEGKHFVSIRPHRIGIHPEGAPIDGAEGQNILDGEVTRGYFLGNAADYLVKVPGLEEPLRVEGDPSRFFPAGTKVRLAIEPDSVIPVRASEG
jgi:iron(III) transport system ATP-binding protein|tara:strand:+ start:312 stop:1406 length:1095 start_codon:yes stop_codon:yes gene_type:complete